MTPTEPSARPIHLEDLVALPLTFGLTVSHGGDQAAFYSNTTGRFELYALDLRTRERRRLSDGQVARSPNAGFVWGRGDRALYFSRDRDGDERQALFELEVGPGTVRALDHAPQSMDYVKDTHPDGRGLLVSSTRGGQMNVYAYDLSREGDAAWTALTAFEQGAHEPRSSPDGTRVLLSANESADLKNLDGYVVNADGGGLRRVLRVEEGSRDSLGHWHPDGVRVAVTSDAGGQGRVGVLNVDTGDLRWLTPAGAASDESALEFSPDGRWLAVLRNVDSTLTPVLYGVEDGGARELRLAPGVSSGAQFALGGSHLLLERSTSAARADVLLYDLRTDTAEVLLPAEYGAIDPGVFVEAEYVRYPTTDGLHVPALLYRPRNTPPGAQLPALVHVHGGPTWQFFRNFDEVTQFLVSRGYVVLCPNVRGSTGSGVAWRDANLRDWGGRDLEDVAAGAEYLKTLPEVDPARLGVFGGSYGGYLSYLAPVKYPELFRVSVPIVGISDLHALHAANSRDMPQLAQYFRSMMGDPVQDAELWRDRSALTHAARLKAHMFMMHGANDPRCPVGQARGFRDALVALGRREGEDFEYAEFGDEGHGSADVAGRTRSYRLLADYLERRL
ncbi:alpha/beta fold hydrolase [uncultured Deinococcus sp.]|uniref:S9 family peptidase n=1 Tax=uncultured Deinococcus sp. TaxID=158789 RepID=UPI0025874742|nr:alpha/beta fold hydrolase [uncultured Deinococcus sp.]